MVLRCYEAAFCSEHSHRLVVAPVAVFEFICGCAGCFCHQLVAHADAADWLSVLERRAQMVDGGGGEFRVSGAVGYEQPVFRYAVEIVVPGHTHHTDSAAQQAAYYIVFYSAVDKHHCFASVGIGSQLFGIAQRLCAAVGAEHYCLVA